MGYVLPRETLLGTWAYKWWLLPEHFRWGAEASLWAWPLPDTKSHPTPTPPKQQLLHRNAPHCPCRIPSLQQAHLRPPDWQFCLKAFPHWFGVDRQDHNSHSRGVCDMLGQGKAAKEEVSVFPMWLLGNGSPFVCTGHVSNKWLYVLSAGEPQEGRVWSFLFVLLTMRKDPWVIALWYALLGYLLSSDTVFW